MKKISLNCFTLTLIINQALFAQDQLEKSNGNRVIWESASLLSALSPEFDKKRVEDSEHPVLIITTDNHTNLHGLWKTKVPVNGGKYYSFSITKKTENIGDVRKATPVNIHWVNNHGDPVLRDRNYSEKRLGLDTFTDPDAEWPWLARPEIPCKERVREDGSIEVSGVFQAPSNTTHAVVQLHLRWVENAKVAWSNFSLKEVVPPLKKKVKVATVFLPSAPPGGNALEAAEIFSPFIKKAAAQGAGLICLPEFLNKRFTRLTYEKVAARIPGPVTEYFARLAKANDLHIVAGLVEKEGNVLYNTAVLVGPEGYVGKYRKAALTLGEANTAGFTPGNDYPVFETKIGKIGMMICYDLYFPEVARNLTKNGAEIIAMPIAGGNPVLAQARAIENQVYLVTSTYDTRAAWIKTAIFDYDGKMLDFTDVPGTLAMAEIEISELPRYWAHQGNLSASIYIQEP